MCKANEGVTMNSNSKLRNLVGVLLHRLQTFLMAPASNRPLAVLRIGIGTFVLLQGLLLFSELPDLYGPHGMLQPSVTGRLNEPHTPQLHWITEPLSHLGVAPMWTITLLHIAELITACGLILGWRTRLCALSTWLIHLLFISSNDATVYGAVEFVNIALFYLVWFPSNGWMSMDLMAGRASAVPTWESRLGLRVIQLHMIVVYVSSGLHKAQGEQWWNGEAIWRAVMRTDLGLLDFQWLASVPWLAVALAWGTLVLEVGYGLFVLHPRTRRLAVWGIISLHVGIACSLSLFFFSSVMIMLNVAAWLVPAEVDAAGTFWDCGKSRAVRSIEHKRLRMALPR
jgi:hypothetical protein